MNKINRRIEFLLDRIDLYQRQIDAIECKDAAQVMDQHGKRMAVIAMQDEVQFLNTVK